MMRYFERFARNLFTVGALMAAGCAIIWVMMSIMMFVPYGHAIVAGLFVIITVALASM